MFFHHKSLSLNFYVASATPYVLNERDYTQKIGASKKWHFFKKEEKLLPTEVVKTMVTGAKCVLQAHCFLK
jgi:DNA recombination-dependent growth factor C